MSPQLRSPQLLGLPAWATEFRPSQAEAITRIVNAYQRGATTVVLDAPTGSGKTLIAEATRRMLRTRAVYVCATKQLQRQFLADFPDTVLLQGRSNYPTYDHPGLYERGLLTADDCNLAEDTACPSCPGSSTEWEAPDEHGDGTDDTASLHCSWCHPPAACPYQVAKRAALRAELAVLNISYLLAEANGAHARFTRLPFVIVDEADLLEQHVMSHVEVTISARIRKRLGIGAPKLKGTGDQQRAREAWARWLTDDVMVNIRKRLAALPDNPSNVQAIRERLRLQRLLARSRMLIDDLHRGHWILCEEGDTLILRPVTVHPHGPSTIWRHADRWLLMSATIIDPSGLLSDLGFDGEWECITVDSRFPRERRPIVVRCVADMTARTKDVSWPMMTRGVSEVLDHHQHDRVLIHAVSYDLAATLVEGLARTRHAHRVVDYTIAADREKALARFRALPGAVMVAPSMERGVDLPGDECRVIVIAKIPYLSLGDRQVAARLRLPGGQRWYETQAVRTLVQATGRGMRSDDDSCVTYVLDKQFLALWRKARRLFPRWWADAIDWTGSLRDACTLAC